MRPVERVLDAALSYAAHGLPVIRLHEGLFSRSSVKARVMLDAEAPIRPTSTRGQAANHRRGDHPRAGALRR
jgi:hypothetical protein